MPTLLLHQYPPVPGLLSLSPFCCKVHAALRLRGLEYQVRSTMFAGQANEYAQLPLLEWDGEKLNDSSAILQAIDQRASAGPALFPADPDVHLLEDWADESLYWYGIYAKFHDDQGWARLGPHVVRMLPAPIRPLAPLVLRRRMRALLRAQGLLRRARPQAEAELDRHLDMLEQRLQTRRYLCGDAPTAADCSVASILTQPLLDDTAFLGQRIGRRPKLAEYLKRFRKESRTEP